MCLWSGFPVTTTFNFKLGHYRDLKEFGTAEDLAQARAAAMMDTDKAVAWLVAHADIYGVDPNMIVLAGASAGAITALNFVYGSGLINADHIRLVVDLWGSADEPGLQDIHGKAAPYIIIHGTEDAQVPFSAAQSLVARARETGLPYAFYPIEGAGHGVALSTQVNGRTLYQHIADFSYQQLHPKTAPK